MSYLTPKGNTELTTDFSGIASAKDLSREPPRGFSVELEGYPQLPRTLDKARAHLAGTAGHYTFGCPVDHTLMARLGVTPEELLELAAKHADDDAVLAALRERGIPSAEVAWFDAQAVEDEVVDGPYLRVRRVADLPGGAFPGAEHGAEVDVTVIEAPPGSEEESHAHARAEVVVVTGGSATYFLGERQARTLRAGEIVRIPAGVEHRFAVRGDELFRAVSVLACY